MAEYLTTKELAALLRIKERKVYDLAASGKVPCSKAIGKLLFPRTEIEAWIAAGQSGVSGTSARPANAVKPAKSGPNVFLGSHDPLLEWALRQSQSGFATFFDGSRDGIDRLGKGEGIAAGVHLYDVDTHAWNTPAILKPVTEQSIVLVEWARRQRGLIVRPEITGAIAGLTDLGGHRVAARQPEAGAELLFRHLALQAGLDLTKIEVTEHARTETDAALAVLEGHADVTFGLQSLAVQYRLGFVPIITERFDLIVDRRAWFDPPMQAFLSFCETKPFRDRAAGLAGYDISNRGYVHFNA